MASGQLHHRVQAASGPSCGVVSGAAKNGCSQTDPYAKVREQKEVIFSAAKLAVKNRALSDVGGRDPSKQDP